MWEFHTSVETVVLLSKLNTKQHIEVELNLDELDLTAAESKATYDEIKAYVLEKHGLKVSSLYISQVKRKCGLDVGQNYNLSKKEDAKVPQLSTRQGSGNYGGTKAFSHGIIVGKCRSKCRAPVFKPVRGILVIRSKWQLLIMFYL